MISTRRATLRAHGGPDHGRTMQLAESVTMMGRALGNDIVVDESWVSRQHAVIRRQRDGYWIEDMGSQNGTFVNGQQVSGEGRELRHGDRIELGRGGTQHWWFDEPRATVVVERPLED